MKNILKRLSIALLPITSLFALSSCNGSVVITLDSGAGAYTMSDTKITLHVQSGTKFKDLKFIEPTSFYKEMLTPELPMPPRVWVTEQDEVVQPNYTFNKNITLTAKYFNNQDEVIAFSRDILATTFSSALADIINYRQEFIASYDQMIDHLYKSTNEFQALAITYSSCADLGGLRRALMNNKPYDIALGFKLREWINTNVCLACQNAIAVSFGKIFSSLYDACYEVYNDNIKQEFNSWIDYYLPKLKDTAINHDIGNVYEGFGTFNQGYVGAIKRSFVNNRLEAVVAMNRICNIYNDAFPQCQYSKQGFVLGKNGASLSDAAAETYEKGYFDYYCTLAQEQVNLILNNWGQ